MCEVCQNRHDPCGCMCVTGPQSVCQFGTTTCCRCVKFDTLHYAPVVGKEGRVAPPVAHASPVSKFYNMPGWHNRCIKRNRCPVAGKSPGVGPVQESGRGGHARHADLPLWPARWTWTWGLAAFCGKKIQPGDRSCRRI